MLTASELEDLARTVLATRGAEANRIAADQGIRKSYGDNVVLIWDIVRTFQSEVVDELEIEMAWAHPRRNRETHQRILVVRNGRVTLFCHDQDVEEHLIQLVLLDLLARQAK